MVNFAYHLLINCRLRFEAAIPTVHFKNVGRSGFLSQLGVGRSPTEVLVVIRLRIGLLNTLLFRILYPLAPLPLGFMNSVSDVRGERSLSAPSCEFDGVDRLSLVRRSQPLAAARASAQGILLDRGAGQQQ